MSFNNKFEDPYTDPFADPEPQAAAPHRVLSPIDSVAEYVAYLTSIMAWPDMMISS